MILPRLKFETQPQKKTAIWPSKEVLISEQFFIIQILLYIPASSECVKISAFW